MLLALLIIAGALIAVGGIVLIIKSAQAAKERARIRLADMGAFATQMGLSFTTAKDTLHDEQYDHFEIFRQGFDRYAYNTISGPLNLNQTPVHCNMGDFHYKTRETYTTTDSKGRTTTRTRIVPHHFSYFIVELPYHGVPDVLIRREGFFDKIAAAFGKEDIDFESSEFSRKYYVKSDDRKFAYDILHPRMIEFLLESKPGLVDMENSRICLTGGYACWDAPRFESSLEWATSFLEHWPEFVIEDLQQHAS